MNILVWLGNEQMHPAIYPNMKSIADAFAELGHRVITCNTAVTDEVMAAISLLRVEKIIDLSIGPNGMGMDIKVMEVEKSTPMKILILFIYLFYWMNPLTLIVMVMILSRRGIL